MSMIKQSISKLKKNFASLFILQFLFFFLNFFYLIFIKGKTEKYLEMLKSLTPSVESIQGITDQSAQAAQIQSIIQELSTPTQATLLWVFIISPIILMVFWIFFQGNIWRIINKKVSLKQLIISTIIAFLAIVALINLQVKNVLFNLVAVFVIYYLVTVYYNTPTRPFKTALSRFHVIAPYLILLFIMSLVQLFIFLTLYTSYVVGEFFFLPPVQLVIYACICFVMVLFLKILVAEKIQAS